MDKHLHKDIGEQFSEEINSMSQQPRDHIWEDIDKQLDKKDAENYKGKFIRLRKKALLLLLLLIGISTFSLIYFNTSKNNSSLSGQKTEDRGNNNVINDPLKSKKDNSVSKNFPQKQIAANDIDGGITVNNSLQDLFIPGKISVKKNGETLTKFANDILATNETVDNNEPVLNKNNSPEKQIEAGNFKIVKKAEVDENNLLAIALVSKKDSLAVTANNQSQKNNTKMPNKRAAKLMLTAFAAPDYSRYRLVNDKHNNYDNKADIATRERSDLSSSIGVLLGYKIGKRVIIQSGIIYSSSNISIAPTKIYAEKNNAGSIKYRYNTSSGYGYLLPSFSTSPAVGDSLFTDGANHTLRYISFPIIAKYKLGNKKTTFHPGVGVTFNFLTKATLTTDVVDRLNRETEYISKLESIKKIGYSLILTPEVQYQLSKKWSISTMPYFKYSLGAINKGNVVKTYPYAFGLGIGAVYTF